MEVEHDELRLRDLLRQAEAAFVPLAARPVRIDALRERFAARVGRQRVVGTIGAIAASLALFAALRGPSGVFPHKGVNAGVATRAEIASLVREAETIRAVALQQFARQDGAVAARAAKTDGETEAAEQRRAATEQAAFVLYCEADRLSGQQGFNEAVRDRYAAIRAMFPDTIWARLAEARVGRDPPIEKG